jgi:hypothetical protein
MVAGSEWPRRRFDAAAARSVAIHGNRAVLPVAAWIVEGPADAVIAPDVVKGLGGELAPNKVLEALARLSTIGALEEMPHVGRPHPRVFRRRDSGYWQFVREELSHLDAALAHEAVRG